MHVYIAIQFSKSSAEHKFDILELNKDIGEVTRYPCRLKNGDSEIKLLPFSKMFFRWRQCGHKLQHKIANIVNEHLVENEVWVYQKQIKEYFNH